MRFETSAGWVVSYAMDRRLIELCTAIAEAEPTVQGRAARQRDRRRLDAAADRASALDRDHLPRRRRDSSRDRHLPTDTPDAIDRASLERAHGFSLELVRRLDADLGRHGTDR